MRNLIGYLTILLLLSISTVFPSKIFAANTLTSTGEINYEFKENTTLVTLPITLTNGGNQASVANYYILDLPFQSISDLKITNNGKVVKYNLRKHQNGNEIYMNLGNLVILKKQKSTILISFSTNSLVDSNWGYAKIITGIYGLNIKSVEIRYPESKPDVYWIDGAIYEITKSFGTKIIKIDANESKNITMFFGNPLTYQFTLNKSYINNDSEPIFYDLYLPYSDKSQMFLVDNISPTPNKTSVDEDGNVLISYLVPAQDQIKVSIEGKILKYKGIYDNKYNNSQLQNIGYWNITKESEKNIVKRRIENKDAFNEINSYVIEKLELDDYSTKSQFSSSFESVLRGGADTALDRAGYNVPEDYVDLSIALLRENSVPARMVVGYIPESSSYASTSFFHSWYEYFNLKENRWRISDPSLKEIQKLNNVNPSTLSHIVFIKRSTNPLKPKLPYLTPNEVKIYPVGKDFVIPKFSIKQDGRLITNDGNLIVIVDNGTNKSILFPNQSTTISTGVKITTFDLQEKEITVQEVLGTKDTLSTSGKVFTEIVILFLFLITLSLILQTFFKKYDK